MEITFAPRGILRTVWMKALFHEVRPETVNIRNVKKSAAPTGYQHCRAMKETGCQEDQRDGTGLWKATPSC